MCEYCDVTEKMGIHQCSQGSVWDTEMTSTEHLLTCIVESRQQLAHSKATWCVVLDATVKQSTLSLPQLSVIIRPKPWWGCTMSSTNEERDFRNMRWTVPSRDIFNSSEELVLKAFLLVACVSLGCTYRDIIAIR